MPHPELPSLIGEDDHFLQAVERASAAAPLDRPVLIIGERGTGKELIAARIHYLSQRWSDPYVAINCAALSDDLLETELFGHVPGAFTGATKARKGRFEQAQGGTLFLDELASMRMRLQEKLLRVIEYGQFERVGSSTTMEVDVRLIAAANVDLPAAAARGEFRADLLDRLSFEVITLPPLRARPIDIGLLAQHFAESMSAELDRPHFAGFSMKALETLRAYRWPGNVRELRNVIERAVYRLAESDDPIDEIIIDPFDSPWRPPAHLAEQPTLTGQHAPAGQPGATTEAATITEETELPADFFAWTAKQESSVLRQALTEHGYNQRRTAERLGLSYDQLRHLLKKYAIRRPDTAV
nr:phage shock protein operon transcriptional activator [Oceanococcus sp. HetDA_MAG_MS8]